MERNWFGYEVHKISFPDRGLPDHRNLTIFLLSRSRTLTISLQQPAYNQQSFYISQNEFNHTLTTISIIASVAIGVTRTISCCKI